jgi:hypothetical protein
MKSLNADLKQRRLLLSQIINCPPEAECTRPTHNSFSKIKQVDARYRTRDLLDRRHASVCAIYLNTEVLDLTM